MSRLELSRHKKSSVSTFLRDLILDYKFQFISLQETMQGDIADSVLREIDLDNIYLWKWIPSNMKSGGILTGINTKFYDMGSFKEGKYILQLSLWDKIQKVKWNFFECLWGRSGGK